MRWNPGLIKMYKWSKESPFQEYICSGDCCCFSGKDSTEKYGDPNVYYIRFSERVFIYLCYCIKWQECHAYEGPESVCGMYYFTLIWYSDSNSSDDSQWIHLNKINAFKNVFLRTVVSASLLHLYSYRYKEI